MGDPRQPLLVTPVLRIPTVPPPDPVTNAPSEAAPTTEVEAAAEQYAPGAAATAAATAAAEASVPHAAVPVAAAVAATAAEAPFAAASVGDNDGNAFADLPASAACTGAADMHRSEPAALGAAQQPMAGIFQHHQHTQQQQQHTLFPIDFASNAAESAAMRLATPLFPIDPAAEQTAAAHADSANGASLWRQPQGITQHSHAHHSQTQQAQPDPQPSVGGFAYPGDSFPDFSSQALKPQVAAAESAPSPCEPPAVANSTSSGADARHSPGPSMQKHQQLPRCVVSVSAITDLSNI